MRLPVVSRLSVGRWVVCAGAILSLTACGGGPGSVSGGGTPTLYTVGGTVSGLTATGLVLSDNGANALTVPSGSSTFTFAQALQVGASYDVAVSTQPSGETCTVSSASGTISGDVSSVKVACTADSYLISGTVAGLTATGLKLQDYSGGEILSVSAGASQFSFTQPVTYGTSVSVTVTSQPYWQTCTPSGSNFSGPITGNVSSEAFTCVAAAANVTTPAGTTTAGSTNGTGAAASFNGPAGVATDSAGNIYVADSGNNEIRKISPSGVVTVLAGSTTAGSANGTGAAASFNFPFGVAVDSAGNVYVADTKNNEIRKITSTGVVTTLAGSTAAGHADGTGSAASFDYPQGVAVDSAGNVYVADSGNSEIRKITPAGVVTTLAGSYASPGNTNGMGSAASFDYPEGIAVDAAGNLYVADSTNNEIRKVTPTGTVTTVAGAGPGSPGNTDGTGTAATFHSPFGVTVDSEGNLYVADSGNNEIRMISSTGVVSTLAGTTTGGSADGAGTAASFNDPVGVVVNGSGTLYIGDLMNNEIRQISP